LKDNQETEQVAFLMPDYELVKVETPAHWDSYHAIRRQVLFEARGLSNYDPNGPDERKQENLSLLLKFENMPVGTVRLDTRPDSTAIVRLVAIREDHQRRGHGSVLLRETEELARLLGVKELRVHAAPDAVVFYEKHGYSRSVFDLESNGMAVQLRKSI
jgi:GNAT superfamily N-acetyltransferase